MSLSVLKDIRKIYAGLNADEVREASSRELRVGLVGNNEDTLRDMEDFLVPRTLSPYARQRALRMISRTDQPGTGFDILLCEPGIGLPDNGYPFDRIYEDGRDAELATLIVGENQDIELPLARTFPVFRPAVAHNIVRRVSKENAMVAMVSALPNVIPSFIELPWAVGEFATDTALLTMNQVRMALMLAAIHGQPVGYAEQKASLAAIAAGAFGWRAIARELVGKIPLGGGLIPKAAIAYAGTWVAGTGLDRLYGTGIGMSRAEKRELWPDAVANGRKIAGKIADEL